jgi:tetratricopeptide (TPR) repeat protein
MFEDLLTTFTDRREALALFEYLRHREPHQHAWPLLPILTFIGLGGSGKSTLIEYLISGRCCTDGRAIPPYAYVDFTRETRLRDLLSILIALRDRLQSHADEQGRHLTFPRFDLGAAIANESPLGSHLPALGHDEVRRGLQAARSAFQSINQMGNALGNAYPVIPPLLVALQWAGQVARKIPGLHEVLLQLAHDSAWQWYCTNDAGIGVGASVGISGVLMRLHALSISSRPNKEGREYLVNHVLPAALVTDLLDGLDGSNSPRTWNAAANIVLFLDGFDALLESSYTTAMRLLEVLALHEGRKQGGTDPLLLVIGSRTRLLEHIGVEQEQEQYPSLDFQTRIQDELLAQEYASECYASWHQRLSKNPRYLRLNHLYLPHWLHDFGLDDTCYYLAQIDRQKHTLAFIDDALVKAIHVATYGHPLYLALAAAAVLEAQVNGRQIAPAQFERAPIPVDLQLEQLEGQHDKSIGEYLLSLFLRQLSEKEQDEFIFCAVPRRLDRGILRALLHLPSDIEAEKRLNRYRQLTFVTRGLFDEEIVLHPIVRGLLLRKLHPGDYQNLHTLLRGYFNQHVSMQVSPLQARVADGQAQIEEVYHALALGDPLPAIVTGIVAQQGNLTLWEPLLEAVAQAPTECISRGEVEKQAYEALIQAERHGYVQDGITAIVLYRWLLRALQGAPQEAARLQQNLGVAYSLLPGNREEDLKRAIACFEASLVVRTHEALPGQWAGTQINLGNAYAILPGEDRQANLERAIACYEAALMVYTPEAFPVQWALTQNNLGNAYHDLPGEDRRANLERAIACYEAALVVRTREAFPVDWAGTQTNLGNAYRDLPGGDRQANLERAIACYEAALVVYTHGTFPGQWATTQNNLGIAYANLPGGDRRANLERAIACYEAALTAFKLAHMDYYMQMVDRTLRRAKEDLKKLEQD